MSYAPIPNTSTARFVNHLTSFINVASSLLNLMSKIIHPIAFTIHRGPLRDTIGDIHHAAFVEDMAPVMRGQ